MSTEQIDVAIIGGGPAGLQAALVLTRTGKRVVVFDAPQQPRNGASHGVHNFVGLDGLLPREIRTQAWSQIERYGTARTTSAAVTGISRANTSGDLVVATTDGSWQAHQVILACGYQDEYPQIDGFSDCWADTIIPCPFCDGYENRDRVWGIVATMDRQLDVFPAMTLNWTERRMVIAPRDVEITDAQRANLAALDVPLHVGDIVGITHNNGKLSEVTLDSGEAVAVETLLWTPPPKPTALVETLTRELGLAIDDDGFVATDEMQRTNVDRLWAAGDVEGWMGAIEAATKGGMAAAMIVHEWYEAPAPIAA